MSNSVQPETAPNPEVALIVASPALGRVYSKNPPILSIPVPLTRQFISEFPLTGSLGLMPD
jgi:hypothetical protein